MVRSLVLATILGGLTAFIWSAISWSLLTWHEKPLRAFQNEDQLAAVIVSHTTGGSGTYLLPGEPLQEGMTAEQKKAAQAVVMQKMQKGPIVFAAIRRDGFGSYAQGLIA